LLIYISVEKIIATKYPARKYFLRKIKTQLIYFLIVGGFCSAYNLIAVYMFDLIQIPVGNNSTRSTISVCVPNTLFVIGVWMDIVNRVIIPFVLMIISSIIFLNSIWHMNQRIAQTFGTNQNERKQIGRIISLIVLNISYIIFSLPVAILAFYFGIKDAEFLAGYYFRYLAYSMNFFVLLATNSLFRQEFLSFF